MKLSQLKEAVSLRYIVCQDSGDGMDFQVVNSLKTLGEELKKLERGSFIESFYVFTFKGEILGMHIDGRGEVVFNTSGGDTLIFHYEDGEVIEDERDLIDKFDIQLDN